MRRRDRPAKRREHWFANTFAGWLDRPLNFLAVAALATLVPLSLVLLAVISNAMALAIGLLVAWCLAAVALVGLAIVHRKQPTAWRIGPAGLSVARLGGRVEHHTWRSIREVRETADGLAVMTDTTTLPVLLRPEDAAELVRQIRERLATRSPDAETIPPEQIAAWLGIGLDDSLTLELSRRQRAYGVLSATAIGACLVAVANRSGMPFIGVAWWAWWIWLVGRRDPVVVTPLGIAYHRRRYGWDEVQGCHTAKRWSHLSIAGGWIIPLHGPDSERVRHAVRRMMEAEQEGTLLPRMTSIPDHALSRAESAEVSAERGISPAEGDGP